MSFERFFHLSHELFCFATHEGRFVEVNQAFTRVLGYSSLELLKLNFYDLIHPDDMQKTDEEVQRLAEGHQSIGFINRYIAKDGSIKILKWRAQTDKESGLIFAIASDVTEEQAAKLKFEQFYTSVTENLIYAKTDPKGVILEVNDEFCRISEYSPEELIGKTHKTVNSGFHPPSFFKHMWKTIRSGKVWAGDITNRKKGGELYIVQSVIIPMFDISGKIEAFIAIRTDITERVEYKEESEKILNILNETSSIAKVGGWELTVETGELNWTDETFKILEVEKKEGQNPYLPEGLQLFTDEHKPIIDKAVAEAMETGKPYSLELQAKTPNGKVKWVFTNGKANYKDGKIVSLSGTIQDINDKKLAELRFNQERQRSIQNAKFASLGELAASIAHEINNPLGIISGYTELLQYKGFENAEPKLDAIAKSCERITHIVKNLKRFSRTDNNNEHSRFNLSDVINEAISLTTPKIKRHFVKLHKELEEYTPIMGNDIEIEQVLINLINNAVDATEDSEDKWINIKLGKTSSEYIIEISDSGAGIPLSVQSKMFDPFFTTKPIGKGTGLGLSIVRDILHNHGGSIRYLSAAEVTTFQLSFPSIKDDGRD